MKLGITMPTRTVELTRVPEYARLADEAGFDSIWDWEVYRNPLLMLAISAGTTRHARLGTGLAAAAGRSPFEMANTAADIDELSGGRMILGVGTGVAEFLEAFHSASSRKPLTRMSEYVDVLRLAWQYLYTGESPTYDGEFYRFHPPRVNVWQTRTMARPQIPIHLAAIGPKMMDLVGRKADGWLGYFQTPEEVRERILPMIAAGAAEAGRDVAEVTTTVEEICVIHEDRDLAFARARKQVGFYVAHRSADPMVERAGLQAEVHELRTAIRREGLRAGISGMAQKIVDAFSMTGTPDEVRAKVARWEGAIDNLVLHTPYVPPITAEESEDCYKNIIATFGRSPVAGSAGSAARTGV